MHPITLEQVSKSYQSGENQVSVLSGINFKLDQSQTCAILGPSGSGKSTLLMIIGTLLKPDTGTVLLDGQDISGFNEKQTAALRNTFLGFLFQNNNLLPQYSALENTLLPLAADPGLKISDEHIKRAEKLFERLGIAERKEHFPGELSGGEMQRTALIRALINKPKLILADEPTGNLDRSHAENVFDLLLQTAKEEKTAVITVTHSERLAQKTDTIYRLSDGKLLPA